MLKYYMTDPKTGRYDDGPYIVNKSECLECGANPLRLTGNIVASYAANNSLSVPEFTKLIASVHGAVLDCNTPPQPSVEGHSKASAAQIKKSITPDHLISFVDGRPYKTLKRHLKMRGLEPDTYRARYGLPADYPMVAANYSAARSTIAKELGLGVPRKKTPPEPVAAIGKGKGRARKPKPDK